MSLKVSVSIFVLIFIFGCSTSSKGSHSVIYKPTNQVSAIEDHSLLVLDAKKREELIKQTTKAYKIKTRDKLIISVFMHPELSTSSSALPASKTIVNADGTIQLPKLGVINVLGMSILELKKTITKKLKKILLHPDVTVAVAYPRKQRYFLVGEFKQTDAIEGTYPMTLLELISLGKGIKNETADLRHAYVVRNNKKLPVNLYRLLEKGDLSQNIDMKNKDTVVIPNNLDQFVYTFARVAQPVSSKIPLHNGKLTLVQALSMSKFLTSQQEIFDLKSVYVVRTEMDRIETFELNAYKMFKGEALPFELLAGDVVYVPKTRAGNINTFINQFFPTLQLIQESLNDINMYRTIVYPAF